MQASTYRFGWASKKLLAFSRSQSGQVLVIFAIMLVVLMAGLGLVIDTGYAYQQQRLAQNAADAASLAGAQYLQSHMSSAVSDSTMVSVLQSYSTANHSGSAVTGWYVDGNGNHVAAIGSGYTIPAVNPGSIPTVQGVQLSVGHVHNTFFMRVLNFSTVTVKASASAGYGAVTRTTLQPDGTAVMPMVVDQESYDAAIASCGGYNHTQITFAEATGLLSPFDCSQHAAGFNWGPLVVQANSNSVVSDLMTPNGPYARLSIGLGQSVQVAPGERATDYETMNSYWAGRDVLVPLIDHDAAVNAGCPEHCWVPLAKFAWFHIVSANGHGAVKVIVGYWVDPTTKEALVGQGMSGGSTAITGPTTFGLLR